MAHPANGVPGRSERRFTGRSERQLDVLVVVPRGPEERAVRRGLARARVGAVVVTCGIGPLAAERAMRTLLAQSRPERVIVTGLCGILAPGFRVGEPLVYREIVGPDERLVFDDELTRAVADRVPGMQSGIRAYGSDVVVTRAHEKRALAQRYGAQAVDMETAAVARTLAEAGVAVAALRIGSDGADDDLPELDRALDGSGGLDGLALALAMFRRPVAGARLVRNGPRALAALERAIYALSAAR